MIKNVAVYRFAVHYELGFARLLPRQTALTDLSLQHAAQQTGARD